MAVLIKGTELPKCCADCFAVEHSAWDGNYCGLTQQYIEYETIDNRRQDYCPLVEVPEHGRLIDADVLKFMYDDEIYGTTSSSEYHVSIPVILANIDDSPTVIEPS